MAKLLSVESNYFGVTLYVQTRTGREYACKVIDTIDLPGNRGSICDVQTWPGYGRYRGKVKLTVAEKQTLLKAYDMKV